VGVKWILLPFEAAYPAYEKRAPALLTCNCGYRWRGSTAAAMPRSRQAGRPHCKYGKFEVPALAQKLWEAATPLVLNATNAWALALATCRLKWRTVGQWQSGRLDTSAGQAT
jgi:hypothetical protein